MQNATSPGRKRWFQFTLRDCLIAILAIAATIAPLKLYERFTPPSKRLEVRAVVYRVKSEPLSEYVRNWEQGQWRAATKEEVAAVENGLKGIGANVVFEPKMLTEYGREARFFTGMVLPIVQRSEEGKELVATANVGDGLLVKPELLPNGRVRLDMEMQLMYYRPAEDRPANQTAPANYMEGDSDRTWRKHPEIGLQRINFPAELASGETMFLCEAGQGLRGSGLVIQVQVNKLK